MARVMLMRRLLIVGDSLAGGPPHLCYPSLVAKRLPVFWTRVVALPGKTMRRLGEALARALPLYSPHLVVFQGGGNDLLIPHLEERGGRWRLLAMALRRGGNLPAFNEEEFERTFRKAVEPALSQPISTVVLSIPCLGEDLGTPLNERRRHYNRVLEKTAGELGLKVIRIDRIQEEILGEDGEASPYLMDEFSGFFLDPLRSLTPEGAFRLSERRGLLLTLDGIHPNPRGAEIIAEALLGALTEEVEETA